MLQELLSQLFFWLVFAALLGFSLGFFSMRHKDKGDE